MNINDIMNIHYVTVHSIVLELISMSMQYIDALVLCDKTAPVFSSSRDELMNTVLEVLKVLSSWNVTEFIGLYHCFKTP